MSLDDDGGAHGARAASFGTAVDADHYDAARPGYPAAAVAWMLALVATPSGGAPLRVLDLAAGTGKLTRAVLDQGHEVVAVDPSAAMLAALERSLGQAHGQADGGAARATTAVGTAEALPLPDASVDAVVVGQAWHWVRPAAASAEVARVLRPGGALGLVWNERDASSGWGAELEALLAELEHRDPGGGAQSEGWWPRVAGPLAGAERASFPSDQHLDGPQGLVDLVATYSSVALSPHREAFLARVRALGAAAVGPGGALVLAQEAVAFRYRRP